MVTEISTKLADFSESGEGWEAEFGRGGLPGLGEIVEPVVEVAGEEGLDDFGSGSFGAELGVPAVDAVEQVVVEGELDAGGRRGRIVMGRPSKLGQAVARVYHPSANRCG